MSFYTLIDNSLLNCLIYGYLALSVYLSLRLFDFPDLTIEGSFPLGAAVAATVILKTGSFSLAIILSVFSGFLAGIITGFLHEYLKIGKLLCGIIVATGLYSINFRVMTAKSSLYISSDQNPFSCLSNFNEGLSAFIWGETANIVAYPITNLLLIGLACLIIFLLLWLFGTIFGTVLRFSRRDSRNLVISAGANPKLSILFGMGLANSMAAISGFLSLFNDGTASISMGFGIILTALVGLVIGERILQFWCKDITSIWPMILAPFIGMFFYFILIAGIRYLNVYLQTIWGFPNPQDQLQFFNTDIKVISALIIVVLYIKSSEKTDKISSFEAL